MKTDITATSMIIDSLKDAGFLAQYPNGSVWGSVSLIRGMSRFELETALDQQGFLEGMYTIKRKKYGRGFYIASVVA